MASVVDLEVVVDEEDQRMGGFTDPEIARGPEASILLGANRL